MVASLKKKIEMLDWSEVEKISGTFREKAFLTVASAFRKDRDDNFLAPLAKGVTRKLARDTISLLCGTSYILKDEKVRVDAELVLGKYNTKLNGFVGYYHVEVFVKEGKDVSHEDFFRLKSSWSGDNKEMLYELIDDITDDISDIAYDAYRKEWTKIEEGGKK